MRWSLFLLVGGFVLAALCLAENESESKWSGGVLYVAELDPPTDGPWANRFTPAGLFPLPPGLAQETVNAFEAVQPGAARALRRERQVKVLGFPVLADVVDETMLTGGRLPIPGQAEVLAGHQLASHAPPIIGGRTFAVVGVLEAAPSPLGRAYLLEQHENNAPMFRPASDVRPVLLLSAGEATEMARDADAALPAEGFTAVTGVVRVGRERFYGALVGFLLLVTGGAGLLLGSAAALAPRCPRIVSAPLESIQRHRWLFIVLHAAFFGIVVLGMLVIYEFPVVQDGLLLSIGSQLTAETGLLAIAGRAYDSENIALAAVVTFVLNFGAGSIAMITLPSFVVPGCGAILFLFRALMWGVTLAPARSDLASVMTAHNLTLLLEGEAYVLAGFFAALIPMLLFRKGAATLLSRLRAAVLVNLQGNLLVAAMLLVAAIYEAAEVILQAS